MLLKKYKWLVMSGDYQLIVVIGYELASYLLFYSSARCVTVKELFICKNSIFIGDTKINPLFLFFLPQDNFTVKAVWSVGTPSPCRSSTTVFRLPHKRRKGLHVTPKPCLDWWHEAHFFCAHAKRCFYGDFSVLSFLAVPFFWNREPCMTARPRGGPSRHPRKANREECPYLPAWKYSAAQERTYIPCAVCHSTFSDKSLFLLIRILGGFSQICLNLCLPPFLRLPVSRISLSFSFWAQR